MERKKKKKKRIIIRAILFLLFIAVLILGAAVAATFFTFLLEGEEVSIDYFMPAYMINLMRINHITLMMFGGVLMFAGLIFVLMNPSNGSQLYKSPMKDITDNIKTPAPTGQGQHGSAKWLSENKYDKIFDTFIIDKKKNVHFRKLIAEGLACKIAVTKSRNKAGRGKVNQNRSNESVKDEIVDTENNVVERVDLTSAMEISGIQSREASHAQSDCEKIEEKAAPNDGAEGVYDATIDFKKAIEKISSYGEEE